MKMQHARTLAACAGLAALVAVPSAGCSIDSMFDIRDPDVATEESLVTEAALPTLHAGAVRDFQVAYTGHPGPDLAEGVVLLSGLFADEYEHSGTFPTRREIDRRDVSRENVTAQNLFRALHRARVSARRADRAFERLRPDDSRRAEVLNLEALTYVYFGELYCSGVPFSDPRSDGPWVYGEPTPTAEIFQIAVALFDRALVHPQASEAQRHVARVGRGRALLNLGQFSAASASVATVPSTFVYTLLHSETTVSQQNGIWAAVNNVKRYRIADRLGTNGLPFRSSGDPRIDWFENGSAFDPDLVSYSQGTYPDRAAPVWPVRGTEARLIQAEAALRDGNLLAFAGQHNELRELRPGLAPFTLSQVMAMTEGERLALHFRERAFWLWQSGHRLGDLRRLVRQYGRPASEVFPSGAYPRGGAFGTDVNFPIPVDELNNPRFTGCLNRDP
jgi:starch-binding outer membrane protein, SusD/RagB family